MLFVRSSGQDSNSDDPMEIETVVMAASAKADTANIVNSQARVVFTVGEPSADPWVIDPSASAAADTERTGLAGFFTNGPPAFKYLTFRNKAGDTTHIDQFGNVTRNPPLKQTGAFYEGLAQAVAVPGGPAGFVDTSQRIVIPAEFDSTSIFVEGLASGHRKGAPAGSVVFDRTGKTIIEGPWRSVNLLFENRLGYLSEGKWGLMDRSGKPLGPAQWDAVGNFRNGLAPVRQGNLWGYVGLDGRTVITPAFRIADPFRGSTAMVSDSEGRYFLINRDGRPVSTEVCDQMVRGYGGNYLFRLASSQTWGVMGPGGQVLRKADWTEGRLMFGYLFLQRKTAAGGEILVDGPNAPLTLVSVSPEEEKNSDLAIERHLPLIRSLRFRVNPSLSFGVSDIDPRRESFSLFLESRSGARASLLSSSPKH